MPSDHMLQNDHATRTFTHSLCFNMRDEGVPQERLVAMTTDKEIFRIRIATKSFLATSPSLLDQSIAGGDV